jgi:hypothetical protein
VEVSEGKALVFPFTTNAPESQAMHTVSFSPATYLEIGRTDCLKMEAPNRPVYWRPEQLRELIAYFEEALARG